MATWTQSESIYVFSPSAVPHVNVSEWAQKARTFLQTDITVLPGFLQLGTNIVEDCNLSVHICPQHGRFSPTRVDVFTTDITHEPEAFALAQKAVDKLGGAGFDALLARTKRVWNIHSLVASEGGDTRAPLVLAAVMATVLLAPVLLPNELTIGGVRTIRERLIQLRWPE